MVIQSDPEYVWKSLIGFCWKCGAPTIDENTTCGNGFCNNKLSQITRKSDGVQLWRAQVDRVGVDFFNTKEEAIAWMKNALEFLMESQRIEKLRKGK